MGQRMLMVAGSLLALMLALVPALIVGAIAAFFVFQSTGIPSAVVPAQTVVEVRPTTT